LSYLTNENYSLFILFFVLEKAAMVVHPISLSLPLALSPSLPPKGVPLLTPLGEDYGGGREG